MTYTDVPIGVADPDQWLKQQARKEHLLANVRTGDWLSNQVFPPLRFAVDGVIPEGFSVLSGAPKLGKSWLVLSVCLSVASGGTALGCIPVGEPRPVLYLALEDGHRRLQERCNLLLLGTGIIPANLHVLTQLEPGTALETIRAWLDIHGPDSLVVIDTAGRIKPPPMPGESAYQADYKFGAAIKKIPDDHPGMSLVVVHHTRKAKGGDWLEDTSGTNGLPGSADSVLILDRQRNSTDGILKVTGRDIPEAEYGITTANGIWTLAGKNLSEAKAKAAEIAATSGLSDDTVAVVEFVHRNPHGVRAKEVALALGMPEHKARTYLGRLADQERINKASRGLYTPVATVALLRSDLDQRNNATHATGGYERPPCDNCGQPLAIADVNAGDTTHDRCEVDQ
ncbi:MAG: AAA family ATPase [Actinomycetes bacterium]